MDEEKEALVQQINQDSTIGDSFATQSELRESKYTEDSDGPEDYVPNEYFGIRVKPGITAFNVFSLFLMTFIVTLCSDDTLSLLQPMLQNKDYYNLTREEATAVVSRGGQINTLPGIIMGIASGYIYDIFGRKKTLIISIVSLGVTYFFFPIFVVPKN